MKIASISLKQFKKFTDLNIIQIPETAKLVILTGPNGSGKSSLFEAFHFWSQHNKRGSNPGFDQAYHCKEVSGTQNQLIQHQNITFHDFTPHTEPQRVRKCFYIRSAYRHEPDFTSGNIAAVEDIFYSPSKLQSLIRSESRISENYNRIVGEAVQELFNDMDPHKKKIEIRDQLIGEIRSSMLSLFDELILSGVGNPTSGGTFRFDKGINQSFHFKNLSGGEKAAFDLLLDFIVKKQFFNDTIFCIDEPELHMHTKLQGRLLQELFGLLPDNCQLWISTHSIGMVRKAEELSRANPGQVIFIDFHDKNFDEPVILKPVDAKRDFWVNMFSTALDDLAQLVVPARVIFCEGKRLANGKRCSAFDCKVYSKIFATEYANTDFIPLGGVEEVRADGKMGGVLLKRLAPGIETWAVYDRDDRSEEEINELKSNNIRVLNRRDLESYLWGDEILRILAKKHDSSKGDALITKKQELLKNLSSEKPADDIKAISGQLYNFCKQELRLTQCGNNAEKFAEVTLAPLITPDTSIYKELEQIIFKNA